MKPYFMKSSSVLEHQNLKPKTQKPKLNFNNNLIKVNIGFLVGDVESQKEPQDLCIQLRSYESYVITNALPWD